MNYNQNDNELIYLLNEDSDHYRYILFEKYKPIIISIVNDYYDEYDLVNFVKKRIIIITIVLEITSIVHFMTSSKLISYLKHNTNIQIINEIK